MNDKIMEAVVALDGNYKNVCNNPPWNCVDGICSIFLDSSGYWLTLSDFESVCNCERAEGGDLTPICTVAEFEEAAAKWKASQPKIQGVDPDVISFELETGKHAAKMADGKFGIIFGEYVVYDDGYDPLLAVMGDIVEVVALSKTDKGAPILGYGFQHVYTQADVLYSLWKKPVKTPQQLEIERLQKLLVDTQAELDKLTKSDTGGLNG
jgi:hypothetical protein